MDSGSWTTHESHLAPSFGALPAEKAVEIDVSIVMPCLNEAAAIEACVTEASAALAGLGLTGEVIVVDNGSSDGSAELAVLAGARVVHELVRGYGSACRRGLAEARGRWLVLGDADGTYDFSALSRFVAPLANGADMVVGNRLNDSMESGAMPWLHRHVGNPFLTWALNSLFVSQIEDAHCGLRSIRSASYRELLLTASGMEFASEFLVEAMRGGARIDQVPIRYRRRMGGQPKLRTFRDGLRHLRLLLSLWSQDLGGRSGRRRFASYGDADADRIRL
jgi:glycosyltransferase involved in cell wall biosynthesis